MQIEIVAPFTLPRSLAEQHGAILMVRTSCSKHASHPDRASKRERERKRENPGTINGAEKSAAYETSPIPLLHSSYEMLVTLVNTCQGEISTSHEFRTRSAAQQDSF